MIRHKMPKPTDGKAYALYLVEEGNPTQTGWGDYYHIRAHMAVVHRDSTTNCDHGCEIGGVRYGDFTESRPVDEVLSHLLVNSQGNCDAKNRSLYAWEVELRDLFAMDLRRAEAAVFILRTVQRRMEKEAEQFGSPQTFGQYVTSVARALGCEYILFQPSWQAERYRNGGKTEWADGYRYHAKSVGEAVARIDGMVFEFVHATDDVVSV